MRDSEKARGTRADERFDCVHDCVVLRDRGIYPSVFRRSQRASRDGRSLLSASSHSAYGISRPRSIDRGLEADSKGHSVPILFVVRLCVDIGGFRRRASLEAHGRRGFACFARLFARMVRVLSGAVDRALAVRTRYVVVAAAWITYACLAPAGDRRRLPFASGESGLRSARTWFGLALVPFGTGHFVYLKFTAALVPAWLPFHTFVAAFTGAAFIAAALGVLSGLSRESGGSARYDTDRANCGKLGRRRVLWRSPNRAKERWQSGAVDVAVRFRPGAPLVRDAWK